MLTLILPILLSLLTNYSMSFYSKIFGDPNENILKEFRPIVEKMNDLEPSLAALSDEQLKAKTPAFKERLSKGETINDILPEAFAVVREASKRSTGMRHFDVQMIGGMVLHRGHIAEMRTGEGKTLVATLPAYLNALEGKGVHVVTVNDYLAKRDAVWMGKIYDFLGLSVGVIQNLRVSFVYDSRVTKTSAIGPQTSTNEEPDIEVRSLKSRKRAKSKVSKLKMNFSALRPDRKHTRATLRMGRIMNSGLTSCATTWCRTHPKW